MKKSGRSKEPERFREGITTGFILIIVFCTKISLLFYFGVVTIDLRSIDGATVVGLATTVSLIGAFQLLKKVYEDLRSSLKGK